MQRYEKMRKDYKKINMVVYGSLSVCLILLLLLNAHLRVNYIIVMSSFIFIIGYHVLLYLVLSLSIKHSVIGKELFFKEINYPFKLHELVPKHSEVSEAFTKSKLTQMKRNRFKKMNYYFELTELSRLQAFRVLDVKAVNILLVENMQTRMRYVVDIRDALE